MAHHGLIKLLVEEGLHTFTIPIAWEIFINMTEEDDIKVVTYDNSPFDSEGEEQQGEEGEETEEQKEREETKPEEEETKTKQEETKPVETEKTKREEQGVEKIEVSPETLEREVETTLPTLNIPVKPKQKRTRRTSMYFRSQKSTRIKMGKPRPSSTVPIIIEDSPTIKGEESPSKTPITYERGSPKSSTAKERLQLQDSKTTIQEAQTFL